MGETKTLSQASETSGFYFVSKCSYLPVQYEGMFLRTHHDVES